MTVMTSYHNATNSSFVGFHVNQTIPPTPAPVNTSALSNSQSQYAIMNQPVSEVWFYSLHDLNSLSSTHSMATAHPQWRLFNSQRTWRSTHSSFSLRPRSPLPPLFYYKNCLHGSILKRTHTKVIFKKWNRCVFVCKQNFLQLYRTESDWIRNGPVYWQTNYHAFMVFAFVHLNHSRVWLRLFVRSMRTSLFTHLKSLRIQEQ